MTRPKQEFLDRLKAELPSEFVVVVRPFTIEEDRSITHFVNILMVPRDRLHDVVWRAWEVAEEVYGDEPMTFLMTAVSPESSVAYFAEELSQERESRRHSLPLRHVALPQSTLRRLIWKYFARASSDISSSGEQRASPYRWVPLKSGPSTAHAGEARLDLKVKDVDATVRPADPRESGYPYAA